MKSFLGLLILMVANLAVAADAIQITRPGHQFYRDYHYTAPFEAVTRDQIELGDNLSLALLSIQSEDGPYRVSAQVEISATLNNEGPHLDLLDWKHCVTPWTPLNRTAGGDFALPDLNAVDPGCFPEYSQEEARAEVLREGGEDWLMVFDLLQDQGAMPLDVSLSELRLRIERRQDGEWTPFTLLALRIPMGC